jgi:hypothetical protein
MLWKRSRWKVRAAKPEELAGLQADLAKDKRWEQLDLSKSVVCVTTRDGEIMMYGSARLIWQIEPIKWMRGKRGVCNAFEQKKSTYLAIRWLHDWLSDVKNNPLIRGYFCAISNRTMQKLAISFGMMPKYLTVKFFGKNL